MARLLPVCSTLSLRPSVGTSGCHAVCESTATLSPKMSNVCACVRKLPPPRLTLRYLAGNFCFVQVLFFLLSIGYFSCPFAKDIDKHVSPWTLQLSFVYRNVCSLWAFYLWPAVSFRLWFGFGFCFCLCLWLCYVLFDLLSHLQVLRQDIIVPEPALTLFSAACWVRFKSNVKCNECEPEEQE